MTFNPSSWKKRPWAPLLTRQVRFLLDILILGGAFYLAYQLRFEFNLSENQRAFFFCQLPLVILIQFGALYVSGAHSFIWRYTGLQDMRVFWKAGIASAFILLILRFALPDSLSDWRIPISIIFISSLLGSGGTLGLRILRRHLYENYEKNHIGGILISQKRIPALLVGAGQAGVLAVREIHRRPEMELDIKGFVDDDPRKKRQTIHGVEVLGPTKDLPYLVNKFGIDQVIITIARGSRTELRRIVKICEEISVKVRIIPGLYEILQGKVQVSQIRDVEIEDLLGREPVHLEEEVVNRFVAGKKVMVTGAGGSIGSELCRQILKFKPASLLLVERAEFVLFEIDRELGQKWPKVSIVPLVADIGDKERMGSLFTHYGPQVLFHAAAHKHVPMMELNCSEAIKNNTLATWSLAQTAGKFGLEVFVLISTDKAVNPTSVMGASKRLAELVIQNMNGHFQTKYIAVRFGNVLGSSGSVIPIFREQIKKGGPVTVTHPDMVRYFMTIPEASQLVLQAGAMGEGGEIFVLDMGEPVRIIDLAREMVALSGLKPYEDIDIIMTGLRPGEKLFEELQSSAESLTKTRHPKILIGPIKPYTEQEVHTALEKLAELSINGRLSELRSYLNQILPEARLTI